MVTLLLWRLYGLESEAFSNAIYIVSSHRTVTLTKYRVNINISEQNEKKVTETIRTRTVRLLGAQYHVRLILCFGFLLIGLIQEKGRMGIIVK